MFYSTKWNPKQLPYSLIVCEVCGCTYLTKLWNILLITLTYHLQITNEFSLFVCIASVLLSVLASFYFDNAVKLSAYTEATLMQLSPTGEWARHFGGVLWWQHIQSVLRVAKWGLWANIQWILIDRFFKKKQHTGLFIIFLNHSFIVFAVWWGTVSSWRGCCLKGV